MIFGEHNPPPPPGGEGWDWQLISNNTGAVDNKGYLINALSNNVTLTLPASPAEGAEVVACDYDQAARLYVIAVARNGKKIDGQDADYIFATPGYSCLFIYSDAASGWVTQQFNPFPFR